MNKRIFTAIAAMLTAAALSSCALGEESAIQEPADDAQAGALSGASFKVGGKEFTEQKVLCEVTAQTLQAAGATVDKTACGTSGSATIRKALEGGDVDMYWEYTGTAWTTYLKHDEPITDAREQYDEVAKEDLEKNKIKWLEPAPADNTYTIATKAEKAQELGVATISDYARLANESPDQATFCGASEFFARNDGWPGVEKAYAFNLPAKHESKMDLAVAIDAMGKSDPCNFGEIFATDGRVKALGLTVLEDDKSFFPVYNPALTVREDVLAKNPKVTEVVAPITKALTDQALQDLNAKVDVDGDDPDEVATEFLQGLGILK